MCAVSAGTRSDDEFDEFKGDIDAAERRVAREIDPGARALVIAILVFVLLASFVLPHTGGASGLDVLVGDDAAISDGIALPSRVFTWLALVFGVGFSMLALLTRRWALAWIALAGSTVASFLGLLAVWSRQTAAAAVPRPRYRADHRVDRGDPADVPLGPGGVDRTALQLAAEEERRRAAAERDRKGLLDSLERRRPPTTPERPSASCRAPRRPRRPTAATARRWPVPASASLVRPAASAFSACRSNCSARARNWSARACASGSTPSGRRVAHLLLHRAQPPLQVGAALARHLADRVPLVADRRATRPAPRPGRRCRASRPRPAAPPWPRRWRGTRRRARRSTALRAEKNVSWAALNRCHSVSSTSLAARPAAFHSVSRSRNAAAVGAPVGGVGQLLGAFAQRLLGLAGAGALAVELGEMRTAAAVERLAGRRVALPQRVVGLAVQAGDRAPLVEDLAQPVARGLPLRRVGGELLGLGGQRFLARGLRGAVLVALGLLGRAALSACSTIAASRAASASTSPSTMRVGRLSASATAADLDLAGVAGARTPAGSPSARPRCCRSSKRRPKWA